MRVSELRIGNWVWYDETVFTYGISKSQFQVDGDTINSMLVNSDYADMINPIELTEEWLEAFGFRKINHIHDGTIWVHSEFKITWYPGGLTSVRGAFSWKRIEYVHQLQNLYFALTGEELQKK